MATLRIRGTLGKVDDIAGVLLDLNQAYNGLYFITAEDVFFEPPMLATLIEQLSQRGSRIRYMYSPHKLYLKAARFESPGWWDVVGLLNPLESIRKFMNDQHERRKDREYREEAERSRLDAELRRLHLDEVDRGADLLRKIGLPDPVIADYVVRRIAAPLDALNSPKAKGLISGVEFRDDSKLAEESAEPKKPRTDEVG